MKKIILTALFAGFVGLFNTGLKAQDTTTAVQDVKKAAKKTGKAVKKGAVKAGNKTAEVASKTASRVVDQVYKGKQGPAGQTIYIDNYSKYYWIDKKGHKQYINEADLKSKP